MTGRNLNSLLLLLAVGFLVAALALSTAQASSGDSIKVPVLIAFTDPPGPAEEALVRSAGGEIKYSYTIVPSIAANIPERAIKGLEQNPRVARIDLDLEIHIAQDYASELGNTWGVAHIGGGAAHGKGFLGTGIRVAVLDTGIRTTPNTHSDLSYDPLCSDKVNYHDGHGHGTHVAGTVAALRNGVGVVGVAPSATLCIYKVLSDEGGGSYSEVIRALELILEYNQANPYDPIRVTNNSYGSSGDPGPTVKAAFDRTAEAGVLHVAAAGNSGNVRGIGSNCIYPARWDSLIATAATQKNDTRASFSSTCAELELSAPGVGINSTSHDGGYREASGTSMASPHAAGTAALTWAANTSLKNEQVRAILQDTVKPLGAKNQYGYGLVQALAAAESAAASAPSETGSLSGTVTDVSENPIVGAEVVLDGTSYKTTTGSNGGYSIIGIPVGSYQATASADGYQSESHQIDIFNKTTTEKDFVLQPVQFGTLKGTVTDDSKEMVPIGGAKVVLDGTDFEAFTGDDGTYSISGIPYAEYTATATADWYKVKSTPLTINASTITLNFSLEPESSQQSVRVRITSGQDDINQGCKSTANANEIYFGWDGSCSPNKLYSAGFFFRNVNIPRGANITSAYIEFVVDGPYNNQVIVNLCGQQAGDGFNGWVSSCNSSPVVRWDINRNWKSGLKVNSPDIASVIQAIISDNWSQGNNLIITGATHSADNKRVNHRRVFAYERDSQSAAVLVVEYTK
jgi:subtilisin